MKRKMFIDNSRALTGVSNKRPQPPLLVASRPLVPSYVDEIEIENLARFIASLDKNIPYALLAFYPCFYLNDLPTTSKAHALRAQDIAKEKQGLNLSELGMSTFWGIVIAEIRLSTAGN